MRMYKFHMDTHAHGCMFAPAHMKNRQPGTQILEVGTPHDVVRRQPDILASEAHPDPMTTVIPLGLKQKHCFQ